MSTYLAHALGGMCDITIRVDDDGVRRATVTRASQRCSAADMCQLLAASGCYRMVCGFNNSAGV